MSQEPLNRPPNPDDPMFTQWIYQLWKRVTEAGQIAWSQITGTPTTLSGYGITDAQPLDADLTAIAALGSTGYAKRTGANTWTLDTPAGGSVPKNVLTENLTVDADTSYIVIGYFDLNGYDAHINGNLGVL